MFDNFEDLGEVVAMEDQEYMDIFNRKKADDHLAVTKLEALAEKMRTEYSSETSQDAEDYLEFIMAFRQKTNKIVKINALLHVGKYNEIKQMLIDEIDALRNKETIFETHLKKTRNFFENIMTVPYEAAVL